MVQKKKKKILNSSQEEDGPKKKQQTPEKNEKVPADMGNKKSPSPSQEQEGPKKKQRSIVKNKHTTRSLPIEIVAIILSRLPAKSIAKFRCVCKEWLSLTHDPHFLKPLHERPSSCMTINKYVVDGVISLSEFSIGDGKNTARSTRRLNLGRKYYMLSNFVDGLTCAYAPTSKSAVYLLNPLTRELRKLPKKNGRLKGVLKESFGLGIDMTVGNYKVVRLIYRPTSGCLHCEICTVGSRQWRHLGEAPFKLREKSDPVFLHGALHWLGETTGRDQQQPGVFRLDVTDEKFGSMISIHNPPFRMHLSCLKECGGKLWLVFNDSSKNYFEIWTMKDYLNGTWVTEYKFPVSSLPRPLVDVTEIVDGEIRFRFFEGGKWHIVCYNPCSGALRQLFVGRQHWSFVIYKKSLISPKKLSVYLEEV